MSHRKEFTHPVPEGTTRALRGIITDENGNALAAAALNALTVTLYDESTKTVINSRAGQNILNTNGGSVDGSGVFALVLAAADNIMVTPSKHLERHVALVSWTYGAGQTGNFEFVFAVENLHAVT